MDEHYLYGIIGSPLTHSFSREYFLNKFRKEGIRDSQFFNFNIDDASELRALVKSHPGLIGLNVTIPFKERVIPFLDEINTEAREIGAVNTIKIQRKKSGFRLIGYNTDAYGFRISLNTEWNAEKSMKALILGSGGASKAVKFALKSMGLEIFVVSRTRHEEGYLSYSDLTESFMNKIHLIVNTTPLGMFPETAKFPPIPYQFIGSKHTLFDLIYNPSKTLFLLKGEERGAFIINGLKMLHQQAEKSWSIWNTV